MLNEFSLQGKRALVTGAGRGIGRAVAIALAEAGADVGVAARSREQIEETAHQVEQLGGRAVAIRMDVSREEQVRDGVQRAVSELGGIDILCSNAGILMRHPVAVSGSRKIDGWELAGERWNEPLPVEEWHQVLETNLSAAFYLARAVGPHMIGQGYGKVVIVSSTAGDEGQNFLASYCVSKGGLNSLTRVLASEWGKFNITVNAVAPGMIRTDMARPVEEDPELLREVIGLVPLGRMGEPRDVALLVLFLSSAASDYISGQVFTIDGGAKGRGTGI
jgi:2-deoxy-D-gluconate 3-dehydrogenase